ncbi:hypothetical protein B2G71_04530 [Novosphingobium sp. PC22D]|uniref:TonB-dependent receptor n=1 Tax=Novosphingobium sp. PC22D TaxID=1962403 RepID=UPI000BFAE7C6|nr:TonB-dependent receptor [Novosphingobium sp. PC22D]PEQ13603.1 hypothetical protein B2G71_04530 [Novosphingobium sp. PC22D]
MCGTALSSLVAGAAHAQEANGVDEAGGDAIVVTAQRRAQRLLDVPVSVEVTGKEEIRTENLTSLVSFARQNPSIKVQGSGRSSNFFIRGTGSGESQSFDQSVGTFIDDIYHGRSRNSEATFLDLERVEVLKGPQSTFFGNNAIAGAFNIVSVKPSDEMTGWMRGLISPSSGENGGQYALEGAATLPFSEQFQMRVAGTMNGQRGVYRNVATGQRSPNQENFAFRATARYAPVETFEALLKGEISESVTKGGLVLRQTFCPPDEPFTAAGFCAANVAAGAPSGLENSLYTSNVGNYSRLRNKEAVLTLNAGVGDHTLTSTTGYYDYRFTLSLDNDGTASKFLNVLAPERYHQFSQEVRLSSALGQPLEYMAGLYFQDEKLDIQQDVSFFFLTANLAPVPVFAPLAPLLPIGQRVLATQKARTYSGFGSVTWNLTETISLSGGLRYSVVKKDFDWRLRLGTATRDYGGIAPFPEALQPLAGLIGIGTPGDVSLKRTDKQLMPSARIQFEPSPDLMAYASYSHGFKAGGFSVAELSANPDNYGFDPEKVDAYEVGLKGRFRDGAVSLNLAAFRNDFSDLQVVINGTNAAGAPVNFVRNAAQSRAQGLELEARAKLASFFQIAASGTYLDSKYRNYTDAGATYAQQYAAIQAGRNPSGERQDLSGKRTLYAPEWSGSVTGTLTLPVADGSNLIAEATGIFSSRYNTIFTLDPLAVQDGYARLDARLTLEILDGALAFDVIGKNLTDTTILTFSGYQPSSLGSFFQDRQPFRNVAFQVRFAF